MLAETLDRLLLQDYRPLQVIVIDDGSSDGTPESVDEWWHHCANTHGIDFKLLVQSNGGPSSARNAGLKSAKGELIQYMDSDDALSKNKISVQVNALRSNADYQVAYCGWRSWFKDSLIEFGPPYQERERSEEEMLEGYLGGTWFLPPHSYLFRRSAVDRVGPWSETLCYDEDAEYLLRVLGSGASFIFTPGCSVDYRRHSSAQVSSVRQDFSKKIGHAIRFRYDFMIGLAPQQCNDFLPVFRRYLEMVNRQILKRGASMPAEWEPPARLAGVQARHDKSSGFNRLLYWTVTRPIMAVLRRSFLDSTVAWAKYLVSFARNECIGRKGYPRGGFWGGKAEDGRNLRSREKGL